MNKRAKNINFKTKFVYHTSGLPEINVSRVKFDLLRRDVIVETKQRRRNVKTTKKRRYILLLPHFKYSSFFVCVILTEGRDAFFFRVEFFFVCGNCRKLTHAYE
jgi:hypothetical protein